MATSFKTLGSSDVQSTRNKLHEAIPITGSITSGTYGDFPDEENIKNYPHGMFQSCYDYPYLSSSANHIFDLTVGYGITANSLSASTNTQQEQKLNMYAQMAQVLSGYDTTGSIKAFNAGIIEGTTLSIQDAIFVNFARLLSKDEVQKGTFYMDVGVNPSGGYGSWPDKVIRIQDVSGTTSYRTDSPAGEYNILFAKSVGSSGVSALASAVTPPVGLLYYQAGIAVLTSSIFQCAASGGILNNDGVSSTTSGQIIWSGTGSIAAYGSSITGSMTGSSISGTCNGFRERLQTISFSNTTELNSTIYFCRANAMDFNYSSNPTYLTGSKIRVKEDVTDEPISFITTVGLYSADNELLAVGKLSEPLKKTPETELTIRTRLDY